MAKSTYAQKQQPHNLSLALPKAWAIDTYKCECHSRKTNDLLKCANFQVQIIIKHTMYHKTVLIPTLMKI